jgi:hypothetical protein
VSHPFAPTIRSGSYRAESLVSQALMANGDGLYQARG